jgi:hypothetical protein
MPKRTPNPTEQEWRELYQAAEAFKQLAPWEWMVDSDIFGVQNPETDEIGYCCVMGNLGEHFALGLYLGPEGLRGLVRMAAGEFDSPDINLLFVQRCLMASFEDREMLSQQDRDQIKALGLKYRGRSAWPQFRNYTPGYVPWYLTGSEARFLTLALRQTCEVAQRFREDEELLDPPQEGQILVRVSENGVWQDRWHAPDLSEPAPLPASPIDETLLRRLKQAGLQRGGTWESDCFYSSQGVQERRDQRPYYPMVCMFVDKGSGMILPPALAGPEEWRAAYRDHLPALIEQIAVMPREIIVRSAELRDLLAPVAEALGIKLRIAARLPALDEARDSMMAFMGQM